MTTMTIRLPYLAGALLFFAAIPLAGTLSGARLEMTLLRLTTAYGIQLNAFELIHLQLALRKLTHFLAFGLLSALVFSALNAKATLTRASAAALFTLAIGALDELTQSFSPHRTPSLIDLLIDGMGVVYVQAVIVISRLDQVRTQSSDREKS